MTLLIAHPERHIIHLQLRQNDLLKTMSRDEQLELEQGLEIVDVAKGDYLLHQGVHEMAQYFVIDGILKRVVSNAEGDAARFKQVLAEYSKAPGVMRERLYQDMMQQILSNSSKVLVDQKSGSNLLYLPLDKLIQQTHPQQAGAAPQAGAPAANLPPPPTTEPASSAPAGANRSSSRDVVRSREFEER